MSDKPQKRLVSKGEYIRVAIARTLAGSCFLVSLLLGSIALLLTIFFLWIGGLYPGIVLGSGSAILLAIAVGFYKEQKKLEPVAPITRHNTGDLPAAETLVRPSDLPPADQQAELLRAAPQGSETPPEELLRATTNRQGIDDCDAPTGPRGDRRI